MTNVASTSNPSVTVNVNEAYAYPNPSHVIGPNVVTMKLSGKNEYNLWRLQMECLLKSQHMVGFIEGEFPSPAGNGKGKVGDMEAWIAGDSLVKGWILGSLSKEAAMKAVNHLIYRQRKPDFTAKDLWDGLQRTYGPSVPEQAAETELTTRQAESEIEVITVSEDAKSKDEPTREETWKEENKRGLYDFIIKGKINWVIALLEGLGLNPWDKLTNNGNTVLHVTVGSSTRNKKLLNKLLEMTPTEKTLLDVVNSDGSSLLHVAAIGGNTEAVDMLVERNPELLLAKDKEGHTPLAISVSNMHIKTSHCLFKHMKDKGYDVLFSGQEGEDLVILAISCQDLSLANMIISYYYKAKLLDSDAVLTALAQNFPRELNSWERRGFSYELDRTLRPYRATQDRLEEYFEWPCGHQLFITCLIFFIGRL